MATVASIVEDARKKLRDFPKFLQVSFDPAGRTYDLGKPNLDTDSLWVAYIPSGNGASAGASALSASQYSVDARNGLIRLGTLSASKILVEGYYYEWLLDDDLEYAADHAVADVLHGQPFGLSNVSPVVEDVIVLATIVEALWTLLNEYARDIDVITSESVHILASQRYRMVAQLLDHWQQELEDKMSALNLGVNRLEVLNLRRVSRTTNRLVPLYKQREVGDYGPLERIWPDIDDGVIELEEEDDDLRTDVLVEGEPPPGFLTTGYY